MKLEDFIQHVTGAEAPKHLQPVMRQLERHVENGAPLVVRPVRVAAQRRWLSDMFRKWHQAVNPKQ